MKKKKQLKSNSFDDILLSEAVLKVDFVKYLYRSLKENNSATSHYEKWYKDFTKIHGYLDSQREIEYDLLTKEFEINCTTNDDFFYFIYTLESFYSLLLRGLSAKAICGSTSFEENFLDSIIDCNFFRKRGIVNFSTPSYYSKVILEDNGLREVAHKVLRSIGVFHKLSAEYDYVKNLFEAIFDSNIRHSLGEFYTPDWLSEFVIDQVVEENNNLLNSTFLDPTCGSGTFLVTVINKCLNKQINTIFDRVYGFDINPLSVLAAKANYLILYFSFHDQQEKPLVIPIFNCDIINESYFNITTQLYSNTEFGFDFYGREIKLVQKSFDSNTVLNDYKNAIIFGKNNVIQDSVDKNDDDFYYFLDRYFSTCFINSNKAYDYIVGNPPWVNWEYLPKKYKYKSAEIWQYYDLFEFKGINSIFVKEDISVLITYVVIDKFLKDDGVLGFILKETLFKSPKQAAGFRKFFLKPSQKELKPLRVDDLTLFKPFPGINARVALLFIKKNEPTEYPVPYIQWLPKGKKTFKSSDHLAIIKEQFIYNQLVASPINSKSSNSNWITQDPKMLSSNITILGKNDYKARTGTFTGGANGVYWVEILDSNDTSVKIRNLHEHAKNKVDEIIMWVEKTHIYPMLTGSDLNFWNYDVSKYLICPHTHSSKMYPVSSVELEEHTPNLKKYFEKFKLTLENRKGFTSFDKEIHKNYYYTIQRIGEYTFAPYKVAWRYISKEFVCSVVENISDVNLGYKNVVPNEKIIYVSFDNADEAFFLCGLLSSDLIRGTIHNFMVGTQIGPNIIENLRLPKYDKTSEIHRTISGICKEGHKLVNKTESILRLNQEVSKLF